MLENEHVTKKAKMSAALEQKLREEGFDPAYILVVKKLTPQQEQSNPVPISVALLVANDQTLLETNLRRRASVAGEVLSPEGNEVLYLVRQDGTASVCRKFGQTWLWL